ncbi:MAG: AAA family ATPase [Treponema sp.]|nr:AAA family ATPase [Treponema sp.]
MNKKIDSTLLLKVLEVTPASQNIMLVGKHGIGKSQILEKYFTAQGCKVVTLFLGQMSDPGDLIGIPHKNEASGQTEFLPPYWFPMDDKPVVLFLDELNRARPEVLQTIMDLALNRKLAGKALPAGSRIISAVNNGDEYQLTELDPALVSRFNIYEFVPSVEEWLLWAGQAGLDKRVISYINSDKDMLDSPAGTSDDCLDKSPDRRAWQRVSDIIIDEENLTDVHKSIVAGIVGSKAANSFFEYISKSRILTAEELLLGDFDNNLITLMKYGTPEFATINDSIFLYLEKVTGNNLASDKVEKTSLNLNRYYSYLEEKGYREAMAHFANLFSGTAYPNTLAFIVSDCEELFNKVTKFVAEIR